MNEHADKLLEPTVDLIKQILLKHTVAVLEEMRDQILERNSRIATLESENDALRQQVEGMRESDARYRGLRVSDGTLRKIGATLLINIADDDWLTGEELDTAIDAVRKEADRG